MHYFKCPICDSKKAVHEVDEMLPQFSNCSCGFDYLANKCIGEDCEQYLSPTDEWCRCGAESSFSRDGYFVVVKQD